MHKVAPEIGRRIHIPILHIADIDRLSQLKKHGIRKVGLLGTKYTMQQDFYKNVLIRQGIEVVIPNDADVDVVNRIIYDELCLGKSRNSPKTYIWTLS